MGRHSLQCFVLAEFNDAKHASLRQAAWAGYRVAVGGVSISPQVVKLERTSCSTRLAYILLNFGRLCADWSLCCVSVHDSIGWTHSSSLAHKRALPLRGLAPLTLLF